MKYFNNKNILFHGSITPDIKILRPFKRYTPGSLGTDVPPAVYASDNAFYCAGHAIPWSSKDGFDLYFDAEGKCTFVVPKSKSKTLTQPIYLYVVLKENFVLLPDVKPRGHNFWSLNSIDVIDTIIYNDIFKASEELNGTILFVDD